MKAMFSDRVGRISADAAVGLPPRRGGRELCHAQKTKRPPGRLLGEVRNTAGAVVKEISAEAASTVGGRLGAGDEEGSSKNEQHMELRWCHYSRPEARSSIAYSRMTPPVFSTEPPRTGTGMATRLAKDFGSFADLSAVYEVDKDYRIVLEHRPASMTAVIAPHGGGIEAYTSDIARQIAGQDFSYYLFEGLLKAGNFAALHLSSHRFDEASCLELLSGCDHVVAIHGCGHEGERVLLGGRDAELRRAIGDSLREAGLVCEDAPDGLDVLPPTEN
ncbi:MAG: hypothetical protein EKK53_28435 [Burkholderiales bacterium]|nr:MAG: hypothetical protein EKK53_28435 [Burkholderiales bacterium]